MVPVPTDEVTLEVSFRFVGIVFQRVSVSTSSYYVAVCDLMNNNFVHDVLVFRVSTERSAVSDFAPGYRNTVSPKASLISLSSIITLFSVAASATSGTCFLGFN